jgi:hypothetical protein
MKKTILQWKRRCLVLVPAALLCAACYFNNSTIHPSPDGFHNVTDSPFFSNGNQEITGMAAGGETVVAVSYEGTIAVSDDNGVHWEAISAIHEDFADGIRFNDVVWGEGYFFAGGDGGKAAWSKNGRDWYAGVIGPMNPKNIKAVAVGLMNKRLVFVAAGTDGRIAFALGEPTGAWTQVTFSPFGEAENTGEKINALAYGKVNGSGIFVAVGDHGKIAFMNDFSGRWYGAKAGTEQRFQGLAFGNDRFVAVGEGGLIKISVDPEGGNWVTIRDTGFGLRPFSTVGFDPGLNYFVLLSVDSVVGFSDNGESWSAVNFTGRLNRGISAVACTKKRIVLGGSDGMIAYSN